MTNDLSKTNGTALSAHNENPFLSYGEATKQTSIVGKLLKFSKGDWSAGEDSELISEGTRFIANMDELLIGWIRWADMKPTDHIMGKVVKAYQPPRRNELGDLDTSAWETDETGKARDPWQLSNYLLMQDEDGELYTFTTNSRGGLNAVGDLCIKYGKAQRQRPNEYPVIAIGTGSYQHSNKAFGRIKYPTFEVVGWKPKGDFTGVDTDGGDRSGEAETAPAKASAPAAAAAKASGKPKAKARF